MTRRLMVILFSVGVLLGALTSNSVLAFSAQSPLVGGTVASDMAASGTAHAVALATPTALPVGPPQRAEERPGTAASTAPASLSPVTAEKGQRRIGTPREAGAAQGQTETTSRQQERKPVSKQGFMPMDPTRRPADGSRAALLLPSRLPEGGYSATTYAAESVSPVVTASDLPDLVATVLTTSTNPLVACQPYHIRWEIENHGDAPQTFYARYYVGNQVADTEYVEGLPGWNLVWAEIDLTQFVAGTFEAKVVADDTGMVAESDEGNNVVAHSWTWQGTKDMAAIDLSTSTSPLVVGQPYHIRWQVDNSGGLDIPETFQVWYYVANEAREGWTIPGLQAGRSIGAEKDVVQARAGTFEAKLVADDTGAVSEANENNNVVTHQWTWQGTTDLAATELSTTTTPLVAGQPYHIRWQIENVGGNDIAQDFYTYYYVANQARVSWVTVGGVPGGWIVWAEYDPIEPTAGTFEAKIVTDVTGLIAEADEGNNAVAHQWTWQGSPDLEATELSTTTNPLLAGQPHHVRWRVDNKGTATAVGTFYTWYYVHNRALAGWYASDLQPGWYISAEADVTWPKGGAFEAKLQTDTTGAVAESREDNNVKSYNWTWQWPSPAWSGNYHYFWADDNYTRDAALPAQSLHNQVGYAAAARLNSTRDDIAGRMQTDAVWSIYTHGVNAGEVPDRVTTWNGVLTQADVLGYDLSGMKLAVIYACNSAINGDNNVTNATVQAGAASSLGFYDYVFLAGGFEVGPAYVWSNSFWYAMARGDGLAQAAQYARDEFLRIRGDSGNVDKFVIYGNGYQQITPAGYQ